MVFRVKEGHAYKLRVRDKDGEKATLSTGTSDPTTAQAVARMVDECVKRRDWKLPNALVAKRVRLKDAYDAYAAGELAGFLEEMDSDDLDPLLTEWADSGANEKYVTQVRRMIPEGEFFPASRFKRKAISRWLAKLDVTGSTRNRYRAALSRFAVWLIERDVLDSNPVRDVAGAKENDPRAVWLDSADVERLVTSLPEPYRTVEALMANGLEWSAMLDRKGNAIIRRRAIDTAKRTVEAKGGKNKYRTRTIVVTEDWTWPIIERHIRGLLPNAPLFSERIGEWKMRKAHADATEALGLAETTFHDHRHSYAVNALRRGVKPAVVKRQLGHSPRSTEVERTYGVWIVDSSDYGTRTSTTLATTPSMKRRGRAG